MKKEVLIAICGLFLAGVMGAGGNGRLFITPGSAYAETACAGAVVDLTTLDMDIPCVMADSTAISVRLGYNPATLYWVLSGAPEANACTPLETNCTAVDGALNLAVRCIELDGKRYTVNLAANSTNEPPYLFWRYQSHERETVALSPEALQEIRWLMNQAVGADKKPPGAVVAIAQGDQVVFNEAFGVQNMETGQSMTADNLLHIGSTNKAVTSFLMAALVDKGALDWDTPAVDIYPAFAVANAQYTPLITIHHLLSMTSGMAGLDAEGNSDFTVESPARELFPEIANETPMPGAPGAYFDYSNYSVCAAAYLGVLAHAKARAGAITEADLNGLHGGYSALLQQYVLDPIGMTDATLFADQARQTGRLSASHEQDVDDGYVVVETEDVIVDALAPSGGLKATSMDMIRFVMTVMNEGTTPDGARAASAANVIKTYTPVVLSQGAGEGTYAMGWEKYRVNGLDIFGHGGSYDNFNSFIGFFPTHKTAFVIMVNADNDATTDITEESLPAKLAALLTEASSLR